jgi:signal recognition particle receptor subunit alpha
MLDIFQVMTTGGLILFRKQFVPSEEMTKRNISISEFIQKKFLAQKLKANEQRDNLNGNCFIYKFDKDKNLIYVLVCPQEYHSPVFDYFFEQCVQNFEARCFNQKEVDMYGVLVSSCQGFDPVFDQIFDNIDFTSNVIPDEKGSFSNAEALSKKSKKKKGKKKKKDKNKTPASNKDSRQWDPLMYSKKNKNKQSDEGLNYSGDLDSQKEAYNQRVREQFMDNTDSEFSVIESEEESTQTAQSFSSFGSSSIFGTLRASLSIFKEGKKIDSEMLQPVLDKFRLGLVEKNVSEEIARKVVNNLETKLLEEKKTFFTSLDKIVKTALEDSLREILTPKNHVDIIAEALKAKEEGRPYVVVFIGVNGVGKSTNLAKVAYLLKTANFSVMLAACDNFRAGAVEQLKTHGTCLEIPVFDRGYKDDPANIAREALLEATSKKIGNSFPKHPYNK